MREVSIEELDRQQPRGRAQMPEPPGDDVREGAVLGSGNRGQRTPSTRLRRARAASASSPSISSVMARSTQASVTLMP
jgi:hypothetical protein